MGLISCKHAAAVLVYHLERTGRTEGIEAGNPKEDSLDLRLSLCVFPAWALDQSACTAGRHRKAPVLLSLTARNQPPARDAREGNCHHL